MFLPQYKNWLEKMMKTCFLVSPHFLSNPIFLLPDHKFIPCSNLSSHVNNKIQTFIRLYHSKRHQLINMSGLYIKIVVKVILSYLSSEIEHSTVYYCLYRPLFGMTGILAKIRMAKKHQCVGFA